MGKLLVHGILRKERLPAHTIIHRYSRSDLPGILRIKAGVHLVHIERIRSVLEKDAWISGEEVRQAQARHLTIECKWSSRTVIDRPLLSPLGQVHAQGDLVGSPDPAQIIGNLISCDPIL